MLEAVDGEPCIRMKVGKILGRHKMAKHFQLTISDRSFSWSRVEESIQKEASLDGIYVIRTSEPALAGFPSNFQKAPLKGLGSR